MIADLRRELRPEQDLKPRIPVKKSSSLHSKHIRPPKVVSARHDCAAEVLDFFTNISMTLQNYSML